jgi:hypothetical protein
LDLRVLSELPGEVRSWVEDLLEDLKQRGIFIAPKQIGGWFSKAADSRATSWLEAAVAALRSGDVPPDLVAFVGELAVVVNQPAGPRLRMVAGRAGRP